MKNDEKIMIFGIVLLIIGCLFFSGCSAVQPIVSAVTPSVSNVPQETEKVNNVTKCNGKIIVKPDGSYECDDGFYMKESGKKQKERKLTFFEAARQNVYKFFVQYVIIMIVLAVMCPTLFNIVVRKQEKALVQIIRGVQRNRKNGEDINTALEGEQDEEVKKLIQKLKTKYNV